MNPILDSEAFEFLRAVIYRHSGIFLSAKEAGVARSRLSRRLKQLGLASFPEYVALLQSAEGAREIPALLDAVTTNYTFFFREAEHFRLFTGEALPNALRRREREGSRTLRIWSAGCSSGEEAYSIAMAYADASGDPDRWDCRILATDINRKVLKLAMRAVYPEARLERVPQEYYYRYLTKDAETPEGCLRVCEEIRQLVVFRRQNILVEEPSFVAKFDFIFCRNVMIYFDPPTQSRLARTFAKCLARGGYLFAAPPDVMREVPHGLKELSANVYRKG